jgi:hypothetical protein
MWGDELDDSFPGIGIEDWDLTVMVDTALREAARKDTPPPVCRVHALPELGGKVRVVTTGPAHLVLAGDALRKMVWPVLHAIPEMDVQAEEVKGDTLRLAFDQHEGAILFSADLERATDLIPHDLAWAAWSGVCDGLGFGPSSDPVLIGRKLIGPLELQYPDGTKCVSKGAIPMGMSLSWFILSLLQM